MDCLLFVLLIFLAFQLAAGILNGTEARIESIRYLASVRLKKVDTIDVGKGHICGGVIISRKAVLTSAICLVTEKDQANISKDKFRIVAGCSSLSDKSAFISDVANILIHPDVSYYAGTHNVAVMMLSTPVPKTNQNIVPIFLPENSPPDDSDCTIVGWGSVTEGSTVAFVDNARIGRVLTADLLNCKHAPYPSVCFLAHETAGPCGSDTGGPLILEGRLVGILQPREKNKCDVSSTPGTAVDVFAELLWIKESMEGGNQQGDSTIIILCDVLLILTALVACPEIGIHLVDIQV